MESHSNENLLKRLEEAREQVLNQMGPNPEKPNKEAMLKVINAMDDELIVIKIV